MQASLSELARPPSAKKVQGKPAFLGKHRPTS
ncbi:hypothetical protein SSUST1_1377 [Streptococcus suis ST1]|nr:hypothetical protein SSUST1_1377 [Streptococcus suis ST1]RRR36745.1 hypothetical protein EI985_04720 [Streptococcus suis]RRR40947.1 hypothetical protein EI989_05310 [Streptococcus suis]RRR63125.1 hypothetical protein EI991_04490 [Streptococcus suis]